MESLSNLSKQAELNGKKLRVFMLGWEFPPFNKGGLGTACHGLTKSMTEKGINVTFVMPRVADKAEPTHVNLVMADHKTNFQIDTLIYPYMTEEQYKKLKSRYVQDSEKYYAILGCDSSDSNEHIKSQYRKLVLDYHPDKIASKGLPEEFTKFANDKFREIQEAYEFIKKERNLN